MQQSFIKRQTKEHQDQKAFIEWCRWNRGEYPDLEMIYATVNENRGNAVRGRRAKEQGQKAGIPDLCLPVARGGYFGLYMELKIAPNRPTQSQAEMIEALNNQGYLAVVCYGFVGLKKQVEEYLSLPPTATA